MGGKTVPSRESVVKVIAYDEEFEKDFRNFK
jgi:hypothetical protein